MWTNIKLTCIHMLSIQSNTCMVSQDVDTVVNVVVFLLKMSEIGTVSPFKSPWEKGGEVSDLPSSYKRYLEFF